MSLSAWYAVVLALPVLLLGEFLVRRIQLLSRFNIPAPVVGGLLVSLVVLCGNITGAFTVSIGTNVDERWWTWLITTEIDWADTPSRNVNQPFLVAFFTCIGLNAGWDLVKRGSGWLLVLLGLAGLLAVIQNGVGVLLAKVMGMNPLLGVVCGSVSMTGGHGTALGFAGVFEEAGLAGAPAIAVAAATFGLVAGGLLGGPVGGRLIQRNNLKSAASMETHLEGGQTAEPGIISDLCTLFRRGRPVLMHVLLVLGCIKLGAWVSHFIQQTGVTFPIYMGAMLLGVLIRNGVILSGGKWMRTEIIDTLASVTLGIFLSIAMMSLNLIELANAAVPMLVILLVQVVVMALFAWFVTFRLMGRDFDAAVMAGGHCGFGLGATPNAVANMQALVERFGPAPRAFLVLPIVGAFLIDFVNAANITVYLNVLK